MLTVEIQGLALLRFSEDGTPFADVGKFVTNSITVEGTTYQLTRTAGTSFALIGDYGPIATAEWTGGWTVIVEWQSTRFVVSRPSRWRSVLEVHRDGAPVGTIRISWGTYKADLPADIPLAVRAFLVYATLMQGPGKGPFGDQVNTP